MADRRGRSIAGRLAAGALGAALLALPAPAARAVDPEGDTAREPYPYPAGPAEPDAYPEDWVRAPATVADLLLVRPAMVAGLAIGAAGFVALLPFTLPTRTTDDAAHALFDQTLDALARPLGEF